MAFKTKIIYIDPKTAQQIEIDPKDLNNWEITVLSTNVNKVNITDYERTIIKRATKSKQLRLFD